MMDQSAHYSLPSAIRTPPGRPSAYRVYGEDQPTCFEAQLYTRQTFLWVDADSKEFKTGTIRRNKLDLTSWKHNHEFCVRTGVSPSLCR